MGRVLGSEPLAPAFQTWLAFLSVDCFVGEECRGKGSPLWEGEELDLL